MCFFLIVLIWQDLKSEVAGKLNESASGNNPTLKGGNPGMADLPPLSIRGTLECSLFDHVGT